MTEKKCVWDSGKLWLILASLHQVGCGSEIATHRLAGQPTQIWSSQVCAESDRAGAEPLLLRSTGRGWELAADSLDPNTDERLEKIRVNRTTGRLCLDAPDPPTSKNGGMCRMSLINSESDQGSRGKSGYLTCNSAFVSCKGSWADATVVVPVINGVFLSHVCEPYVRHEDLWQAAVSTNAFKEAAHRQLKREEKRRMESDAADRERAEADVAASKSRNEELALLQRVLGNPRPWGLELGVDTPKTVAAKLGLADGATCARLALDNASCGLRWKEALGRHDIEAGAANFAWAGNAQPKLTLLQITFAPESWVDVVAYLRSLWGAEDLGSFSGPFSIAWNWGNRGLVEVFRLHADGVPQSAKDPVMVTMYSAHRSTARPNVQASPFGLQFGEDSMDAALLKLRRAGLSTGSFGCSATQNSRGESVFCTLIESTLSGVTGGTVEFVSGPNRRLILSELEYRVSADLRTATIADLTHRYGAPESDGSTWTAGAIDIAVSTVIETKDAPERPWFSVTHRHGRLWQMGFNVLQAQNAQERAARQRGL